jgi:prepilin peptidase CpaA
MTLLPAQAEALSLLIKIAYAAALCYGCLCDIRRLQIPNAVSLTLLALFFVGHWAVGSEPDLVQHLLAAIIVFLTMFGLTLAGVMGGGDAKLIGALMLWGGVKDGPAFLFAMALFGGAFALLLLLTQKAMARWPALHRFIPSRRFKMWAQRGVFPYGIAICLAGLVMMPAFFSSFPRL